MDSQPGFRAIFESEEAQLFYTGPDNNHQKIEVKGTIDDSTTDSANTPTTTLRAGRLLGVKASDAKLYPYDPDANDGTQLPVGFIPKHLSMLDMYRGAVEDKMSQIAIGGVLKSITSLIGYDYYAAAVLLRRGFLTADLEPHGSAFLMQPKARYFKDGTDLAGAYTVLAADHGCMLTAVTAAMNFTMPTLADVGRGFSVLLFNAVDANMVVTGAANTIQAGDAGGAVSTTITFSTANRKMGASVLMYSDYISDGGALGWFPLFVSGNPTYA